MKSQPLSVLLTSLLLAQITVTAASFGGSGAGPTHLNVANVATNGDGMTAYVATKGNDATAILGRPDRPFATLQAAFNAFPDPRPGYTIGYWTNNTPGTIFLSMVNCGIPSVNQTYRLNHPAILHDGSDVWTGTNDPSYGIIFNSSSPTLTLTNASSANLYYANTEPTNMIWDPWIKGEATADPPAGKLLAIQSRFTFTSVNGGGVIVCGPGTFDGPLVINNSFSSALTIKGAGKFNTVLRQSGPGTNPVIGTLLWETNAQPTLNLKVSDLALVFQSNCPAAIVRLSQLNFSFWDNVFIGGEWVYKNLNGSGATVVLADYNREPPALLGVLFTSAGGNKNTFQHCTFAGLADGIVPVSVDHLTIEDCDGGSIGTYWTNVSHSCGTAYSNNLLATGAFLATQDRGDFHFQHNHVFACRAGVADAGENIYGVPDYSDNLFEACDYQFLTRDTRNVWVQNLNILYGAELVNTNVGISLDGNWQPTTTLSPNLAYFGHDPSILRSLDLLYQVGGRILFKINHKTGVVLDAGKESLRLELRAKDAEIQALQQRLDKLERALATQSH